MNDISNLWWAIFGAFIGLGVTLLYDWLKTRRNKKIIATICAPYEGVYLSYEKYDNNSTEIEYFELTRDKNTFLIKDAICMLGHEDWNGEITMYEPSYKRGQGYYQHYKSGDGATRFGFLDIQLANGEILVHVTIHKGGEMHADSYRWVKQLHPNKTEMTQKYRAIQQQNLKFPHKRENNP